MLYSTLKPVFIDQAIIYRHLLRDFNYMVKVSAQLSVISLDPPILKTRSVFMIAEIQTKILKKREKKDNYCEINVFQLNSNLSKNQYKNR